MPGALICRGAFALNADPSPLLVSIIFRIGGEDGHAFTYNKAVGEAVRGLGWDHQAAVHAGCTVQHLPSGWQICLDTIEHYRLSMPFLGSRLVPDIGSIWHAVRSLAGYLRRELVYPRRPVILFMEFFTVTDLAVLALALAPVPRENLSVCLLYRMEVHRQWTRSVYQVLNNLLRWQVGDHRFTLLSDSQPLANSLTVLFRHPVHVVPIPHAAPPDALGAGTQLSGAPRSNVAAWWPGRPAPDKGLEAVRQLARQTGPPAQQVTLVAATGSGLAAIAGGCQVRLIPNELSNADYWGWMLAADLILLPYDVSYAERTSGIFVEAISAGKPTAVTAGTWMAGELLAHGLPELIVDWSSPDIWQQLVCLVQDDDLRTRLATMQAAYRRFHSQTGFAAALRTALAPSLA